MKNLVEVNNLSISFKTPSGVVEAIRDISLNVLPGETLAIVGESGSGKTVTAKSLMRLHEEGVIGKQAEIFFEEENIMTYSEEEIRDFRGNKVSMIFQDALTSLNPTMTIGAQIAESLTNHFNLSKKEIYDRCKEALLQVGISDADYSLKKYPHELSGGQRQRVMIAMAIVTKPKLLIADEPTTALDVTIQAQILDLLKDIQEETGMSIVLITHDMGVVAGVADRVIVMYAGEIVEGGSSEEIFYNRQHPYTWALLNSVPRIDLEEKRALYSIEGSSPSLIDVEPGCPFYKRCHYAMEICECLDPNIKCINDVHRIRCWLQHEYADRSGIPFLAEVVSDD